MHNNVGNFFTNFSIQHPRSHNTPHNHTPPPVYRKKNIYDKPTGNGYHLTPAQAKFCQEFTGIFNNYSRAIDNTRQSAISSIDLSISTTSWKDIKIFIAQFLDYLPTLPSARIQYKSSKMHLCIHSDSSQPNEKSHAPVMEVDFT